MKVASVYHALERRRGIRQTLVHTGQHYDFNMSDVFFQQLEMPTPDVNLAVGSGSHASQTAEIMARFEPVVLKRRPNVVLVYGDVNSTIAAALVCSKLQVKIGHVEAGLRAFDRSMPEEINRVLTDQIADLLFTPSADGNANLAREGISADKVFLVGNVMIDTLVRLLPQAIACGDLVRPYALLTLHRPSNVDCSSTLKALLEGILEASHRMQIIFPVHPRTRAKLPKLGINGNCGDRLRLEEPMPYIQFLALQRAACVVLTDSGGIQEETTYLGIPCLTLRQNTERPITITHGTNTLVGHDITRLQTELRKIESGNAKQGGIPPLWDGHAGERIADVLLGKMSETHFALSTTDGAGPAVVMGGQNAPPFSTTH